MRDYEGGNVPPLSLLLSCMTMTHSLFSPVALPVNSFSPCLCPQGPCSCSLTLLQPYSEIVINQSSLRRACRYFPKEKVKQTHIYELWAHVNQSTLLQKQTAQPESVRCHHLRQDRSSRLGGFFSLVAMETIVLPSSFLPCIPLHNAMKSKLPFDKADWSGVWKRRG